MGSHDFPHGTIAAISTAPGEGGIGIVRISGEGSGPILEAVFRRGSARLEAGAAIGAGTSDSGACAPLGFPDRLMRHGHVVDGEGRIVDEALAVFMKAPKTYTGEDCAEIHCHGSMMALRKTLELVMAAGAEPAEPGEFTKRAFLNGKLDLAQAEAVIDLIKAKTELAYDTAIKQLDGALSQKIRALREELLGLLARLAADLDYPEEDETALTAEEVADSISAIGDKLEILRDSEDAGRIINEGLRTVIVGKPNVGKSSLMNALLRDNRVIVTEIPGTTRDTIEETANIRGIPVRLTDTAGIRDTGDPVEAIGVEKSKAAFNEAELLIFVADMSAPLEDEDRGIAARAAGRPVIAVLNKSDLGESSSPAEVGGLLPQARVLAMSLKEGTGLADLEDAIADFVFKGKAARREDVILTNARHGRLMALARDEVGEALRTVREGGSFELSELNLRQAYEFLGGVIGEALGDDIIDEVFARFCLGK